MIDARGKTDLEVSTLMPAFPHLVGSDRSGTMLLHRIFDSHPMMAVPVDTRFIVTLAAKRKRYESAREFRVDSFVADVYSHTDLATVWDLPIDEARRELATERPYDYPSAVRALFALRARRNGKARYADKTPIHVLNVYQLSQLFPEAVFIHIIRDGRDEALGLLENGSGSSTIEGAAVRWKHWVRSGRDAGRRLGAARYREVRYEDLVARPRHVAEALCDFVGLTFDERMLDYFERADEVPQDIGAADSHEHFRSPTAARLRRRWSEDSSELVKRFEVLAGDLLDELGYERAFPRPRVGTRLMASRHRIAARRAKSVGSNA